MRSLTFLILVPFLSSCDYLVSLENKAQELNKYEIAALNLARENRMLKAEISSLEFKISELNAKNKFLELQVKKHLEGREPASIKEPVDLNNDMVKFNTYKWKDSELLKIARTEFKKKNYAKASQYFYTLVRDYPTSELIDDTVLFQTGLSSFESQTYYDWSNLAFTKLIKDYPNSKYFRGAKLWRALAMFKKGDTDFFYQTVEEFRLKYRNTPEWKILSKHYEEFTNSFKN